MMSNRPFYGSYWNLPSRPSKAPTVREIPVQYVGSEKPVDRSASAVKIQKVFRGFLVRESVKKIAEIRRQVEEIERSMLENNIVHLIRRDARERLRVNEVLMSLLFKLDSVRGVDSGVRDFRKTVIKKVISLQEAFDAVVSGNGDDSVGNGETAVETVGQTVTECTEDNAEAIDNKEILNYQEDDAEVVVDKEILNNRNDDVKEAREVSEDCNVMTSVSDCLGKTVENEGQLNSPENPPSSIEACKEDYDSASSKQESDATETDQAEDREVTEKVSKVPRTGEENARNRELLENMMDMMAQLYERNEMQTKLLSSLSQRVEKLEKAFMCERLRRKKKRQASGTADNFETTLDDKKCGKR